MKIVGDIGRPTLWAGRVVDLPFEEAKQLIEDGFAVPAEPVEQRAAAETR